MVGGRIALAPQTAGPGWVFVVGRAFLAALPADADDRTVRALAARAPESSVDLESMVTLLPQQGPGALPSFALVVQVPGAAPTVSVLVRGDVAVDVHTDAGSRRFVAAGIVPWLLADFQAVTGIAISGTDLAPAPLNPTGTMMHVVGRGGRLTWVGGAELGSDAGRAAGHGAPAGDDTVLVRSSTAGSDTLLRPNTAEADTVILPSTSPLQRRVGGPTDETQGGDAEPAEATRGRYAFRLDGAAYLLDGSYYLGRRPRAPRIHDGRAPTLLTVPSPTRSVSGTHLEIRQEGDAVVVTDLSSTNGTLLVPPAGTGERLRQGASRVVVPGTRVDIGDGNIVEILPVNQEQCSSSPASNRKALP